MADYKEFRDIIQGSHSYEFDDEMKLTLTGYWSGKEAVLDFENMDSDMFEELMEEDSDEGIGYEDVRRIISGSKRYKFEDTVLSVMDYRTGDTVRLDLGRVTEEMYEELKTEELDEELDDDFEDAVSQISEDKGQSL